MNRKFVKENKKVVREFLGWLLTKIVTGKVNRKVQNLIDNDPEIKKSKEKIKNLEKQMLSKVKIAYKTNPRFKQLMDKHKIAIN